MTEVDEIIIENLKAIRYGDKAGANSQEKRRKKLQVEPGASVSNLNIQANRQEEEDIDDPEAVNDGTSTSDETQTQEHGSHLELSTWVLVKVHGKRKGFKLFIGNVTQLQPLTVSFLKHVEGTSNVFVTPQLDDTSIIDRKDVVKVFDEPDYDSKLRMHFDTDVDLWNKYQ